MQQRSFVLNYLEAFSLEKSHSLIGRYRFHSCAFDLDHRWCQIDVRLTLSVSQVMMLVRCLSVSQVMMSVRCLSINQSGCLFHCKELKVHLWIPAWCQSFPCTECQIITMRWIGPTITWAKFKSKYHFEEQMRRTRRKATSRSSEIFLRTELSELWQRCYRPSLPPPYALCSVDKNRIEQNQLCSLNKNTQRPRLPDVIKYWKR